MATIEKSNADLIAANVKIVDWAKNITQGLNQIPSLAVQLDELTARVNQLVHSSDGGSDFPELPDVPDFSAKPLAAALPVTQ